MVKGLYKFKFRDQESSEKAIVPVLEGDNGGLNRQVIVEAERRKWN